MEMLGKHGKKWAAINAIKAIFIFNIRIHIEEYKQNLKVRSDYSKVRSWGPLLILLVVNEAIKIETISFWKLKNGIITVIADNMVISRNKQKNVHDQHNE